MSDALFFVALVVDGALAGAIYALAALAFVVVYKASRMVNFALGEWVMVGSRLVGSAFHLLPVGLAGAVGIACAGMIALAVGFNHLVLRRLVGQPLISFIMVTIGLGLTMRGAAPLVFGRVPAGIALPVPDDPIVIAGVAVAAEKVWASAVAVASIAALSWFFHRTRTGIALRAVANDPQAASTVGIDVQRYFSITWGLMGALGVLAGTLWTAVTGGGFGVAVLGLKVFPIVIVGGLDSIAGTIVGALVVGIVESLAAGYLDSVVGGGSGPVASYVLLLAVLCVRPYGLFGRPFVERV